MDDYDRTIKNLKKIMDHTFGIIHGLMPSISSDIDWIIKNKEQSPSKIENILDTLMSAMDLGYGEKDFLKLNKYYSTFNKDNANEYKKYYTEWKKK